MSQGAVFQISINLLYHRMLAMGLVRRDRIQGAGGEEAWNRWVSNSVGWPSVSFGFNSGIRRTTRRPGICSTFFCPMNAVKGTSATSATETYFPDVSSRIALVYWIVVHASSPIVPMARLTAGSIRAVIDTFTPAWWAVEMTVWP